MSDESRRLEAEPGETASYELPGPSVERRAKLFSLLYSSEEVERKFRRIHEAIISHSPQIREGDFTMIGTDDLERLFVHYDREFFKGRLGEMLVEDDAHPAAFRLSRRLTSAAGLTTKRIRRVNRGDRSVNKVDYEITVSTTLLYNAFQNADREVTVGGLPCRNRLEALQRIFEHELLHLAEFLAWGTSNCSAQNYKALSQRIFAHAASHHDLITTRERARTSYNVQVGDEVEFEVQGRKLVGIVSRITRRASVLVEDPRGSLYSDGKHRLVYYVPLPLLARAARDGDAAHEA